MSKLKPCRNCNKTDYEYGSSLVRFGAENLVAYAEIKLGGAVGKFVGTGGAGMGILSLPKLFYQGVFLGLDGNPLLRCRHCNNFVVCCHKCDSYMTLERHPGTAELIECPFCKAKFQTCERDDKFDELLQKLGEDSNNRTAAERAETRAYVKTYINGPKGRLPK